jgi:hypothetical protein
MSLGGATSVRSGTWICPRCGAPFANANASHSCVNIDVAGHFATSEPRVRAAFDRLVQLASVESPVSVIAQKTRIVFAAPMRFLAIHVRRDRLTGHVFHVQPVPHPVVSEIVPDAYGSGLYMHRITIRSPDELDASFAQLVRDAAGQVGRRERFVTP